MEIFYIIIPAGILIIYFSIKRKKNNLDNKEESDSNHFEDLHNEFLTERGEIEKSKSFIRSEKGDSGKQKSLKEGLFPKKGLVELKVDIDFNKFTYAEALEIITRIEDSLDKKNIKLRKVSKGSTLLSLELDYEDAMKLIQLIQGDKLKAFGVKEAKIQTFTSLIKSQSNNLMAGYEESKQKENKRDQLARFVSQMKQDIIYDIAKCLILIKGKIKETSIKFNQIIILTRRFIQIKENTINGTKSPEYLDKVNAEITDALLQFLDTLEADDIA